MTPRHESKEEITDESSAEELGKTIIVHNGKNGISYVKCTSKHAFVNPSADQTLSHEQVNNKLKLNLGQKLIDPENKTLLWILRFLNNVLVAWWEHHFFVVWDKVVPLRFRRLLTFAAWKYMYLPLHRWLLDRRTGIHPDVSPEYHALTTLMWAGRLFPVTVQRMRFSLSQLTVCVQPPAPLGRVQKLHQEPCSLEGIVPEVQADHCHVSGVYLYNNNESTSEYVLFWLYGGAFMAGDAPGNLGHAHIYSHHANLDVFLPTYRLCPESNVNDILWDVCLAYRWLVQRRIREGRDPSKILLLGISSGGGLAVRLCQSILECRDGRQRPLPNYLSAAVEGLPLPLGAVLLGPFADYTEPTGSLIQYAKHDLIVNPRVLETGLPFLDTHMDGLRREHSPVHRSFEDVPPLCVVASEHEAVYDHAVNLVNNARAAGVPVTFGVWKYVCHVFPFLAEFIPEGEQATNFAIQWLVEQTSNK